MWRNFIIGMDFPLPQEELVIIFSKSYDKHISITLKIQQHNMFKKEIAQANIIE